LEKTFKNYYFLPSELAKAKVDGKTKIEKTEKIHIVNTDLPDSNYTAKMCLF
jgi:hypothetical protein